MKFQSMSNIYYISLLILILEQSHGARIVIIHPCATHSHAVVSWPIATALESKGHNVTFISVVPPPESSVPSNITIIVPQHAKEACNSLLNSRFGLDVRLSGVHIPLFMAIPYLKFLVCDAFLSSPDIQEWIDHASEAGGVDLIIVDGAPECSVGLAHKLRSKQIVLYPICITFDLSQYLGPPLEMVSSFELPSNNPLSFFQRVKIILASLVNEVSRPILFYWIDGLFQKHLKLKDNPNIQQLIRNNISLVLHNGHFLEQQKRSMPPNFVSISGVHIKETTNPLSKEINTFLSSGRHKKQGFIYISLGTAVNMEKLPESYRTFFFNAMKAFPEIKFLWKWSEEFPKEIPPNLHLSKWFEQQDVLGHSDILGFVTQAGRPSSQEALYHSVPMITIPVLADQDYNALMLQDLGVSVNLEIATVTEQQIIEAFSKLVNQTLKGRCKELARVYRDNPTKPLDKAVWWIEYVLRHDSSHLQPLILDDSWLQRRFLDVWIFLLFLLTAVLTVSWKLTYKWTVRKREKSLERRLSKPKAH